MTKTDKIIKLINELANEESHPDPVARLYTVYMSIGNKITGIMNKIRIGEKNDTRRV